MKDDLKKLDSDPRKREHPDRDKRYDEVLRRRLMRPVRIILGSDHTENDETVVA